MISSVRSISSRSRNNSLKLSNSLRSEESSTGEIVIKQDKTLNKKQDSSNEKKFENSESTSTVNNSNIIKAYDKYSFDNFCIGSKRLFIIYDKIIDIIIQIHSSKNSSIVSIDKNKSTYSNKNINLYNSNLKDLYTIPEFLNLISRMIIKRNETFIIASLITFDNFLKNNKNITLNHDNIYLIILMCFTISAKANEDIFIPSGMISNLFNISPEEMLDLEMIFIEKLDYRTVINEERYFNYKTNLQQKINEGKI